ncbi:MAG: NAD(P)/FAD-dependent oxidoreductase [Geminicoccaceae bacterium]
MAENYTEKVDIAIIGAGIAGASVAAELVAHASVLLLEMETSPGYHTTGRSAAVFAETYGPAPIRSLTRASRGFFDNPPEGFSETPLLAPRGELLIARSDQMDALERMIDAVGSESEVRRLSADQARERVPLLAKDYVAGAMYDPAARDIDVQALHQGFLRAFRAGGGVIATDREVLALEREGADWVITCREARYRAEKVVNAAGAWADKVGALAGARTIGLVPKRRTALIVASPDGADPDRWPVTIDVDEQFYLKPDAGRLLISPADETPTEPCDAQAEEMDLAICVDRIETAFDLQVKRIESKWAGLRSFVADKCPVVGYDQATSGFFWLAGQGGYGIQSAPALARLATALALDRATPQDILDQGLNPADLAPERLDSVGQGSDGSS